MTRQTRKFVIASTALLATGLGIGLLAYYGGLPTGAFVRQAGPDELAYVPSGAAVVAYADVHDVMTSDLREKLRAVMPSDSHERDEFKTQTGIDIETDIDHVVACMLPGEGRESGFVALRGRFDNVRLEALAREHKAVVEEYRGKRIVRMPEGAEGADEPGTEARRRPALAFIEPGLIMVGDEAALRLAIDTAAGGESVTANAEVMAHIRDLDADANAWAVGRFDALTARARLPEEVAGKIPAVSWVAVSGRVNGGLSGVLRAEARDDEAARNLRDVIAGFIALGRMQAGSRPEFQTLMQSVALGGSGKTVELSFAVPSELIEMLGHLKGAQAPKGEGPDGD